MPTDQIQYQDLKNTYIYVSLVQEPLSQKCLHCCVNVAIIVPHILYALQVRWDSGILV